MFYLLYRSRKLLKLAYFKLKKLQPHLSKQDFFQRQIQLKKFQDAILEKNFTYLKNQTPQIKKIAKDQSPLPAWIRFRDLTLSLSLGVFVIFGLVRPLWFELYQIPSGSMRPTLKEADRLSVSKTQFGLNIPFSTGHLFFDPTLVKRNGIVIFTVEGMATQDGKMDYFYLFPGYKQYIKRLIGKPGDTLYFYEGKIFGIDSFGNSLAQELNPDLLIEIDHVPFISFEGTVKTFGINSQKVFSPVILEQSGWPLLKMQAFGSQIQSEFLYQPNGPISDYYQFFGFEHFGACRIVKRDRYYLEIQHHPSIKKSRIEKDLYGRLMPTLHYSKSYLPLGDAHLKAIFDHLYTARFEVKNGLMKRTSQNAPPLNEASSHVYPKLNSIPNGIYEFDRGIAYEILFQGIRKKLPKSHPLCQFSVEKAIAFFNFGIEFDLAYDPDSPYKVYPSRYAYYRNGDLYLMGASIYQKEDPELQNFCQLEKRRESEHSDFIGFLDNPPPKTSEGDLDPDFIAQYGLKIPEKSYFVLGDNYAMSADSRKFGFVPEDNLRGVPEWIFWPPGERLGPVLQPHYALFTSYRFTIWIMAFVSYFIYRFYQNKKGRFPFNFD